MNDTRQAILALGEKLIRTKGYHAFSYKDISQALAIKNAAVHYHFPAKSDLGVAIIAHTIDKLTEETQKWSGYSADQQLELFIQVVYANSRQKGWACLMGALSPAYDTLPQPMQEKLNEMGQAILAWLAQCLEQGKAEQIFHFPEPVQIKAQLIISGLLASLLLGKVMGDDIRQSIQVAVRNSL